MQNCISKKEVQDEALSKLVLFRLNQKDCTITFKKTWFSIIVQFCFCWWNIISFSRVFLIDTGTNYKEKKVAVFGVWGVEGSWMYQRWVCNCTTCVWKERKRGSIASFLCLEVLGLIVEITITLKLQFLCPLLCQISISEKSNPCSK